MSQVEETLPPLEAPTQDTPQAHATASQPNTALQTQQRQALAMDEKLKFKFPKPKPYVHGENWRRFTDRFKEWCTVTGATGPELHLFLLSLVDTRTYDTLKTVTLTENEKASVDDFCKVYQEAMTPQNEIRGLRSKLIATKQLSEEPVEDFIYRLRELSIQAYEDDTVREPILLTIFIANLYDQNMKMKLQESTVESFSEAVRLAKRIQDAKANLTDALKEELCKVDTDSSHQNQTTDSEPPKEKERVQCQWCGKLNHTARNCWSFNGRGASNSSPYAPNQTTSQRPQRWQTSSQRGTSRNNNSIVCWHCSGNHRRAECYLYKNQNLNSTRGGKTRDSGTLPPTQ